MSARPKNIYECGELTHDATIREYLTVQVEGDREVSWTLDYYNLDAIISVEYRVNSRRVTQFRQWATPALTEFTNKTRAPFSTTSAKPPARPPHPRYAGDVEDPPGGVRGAIPEKRKY